MGGPRSSRHWGSTQLVFTDVCDQRLIRDPLLGVRGKLSVTKPCFLEMEPTRDLRGSLEIFDGYRPRYGSPHYSNQTPVRVRSPPPPRHQIFVGPPRLDNAPQALGDHMYQQRV